MTAAEIVDRAWDAYRQSQQAPFTGDLLKAQSALFRLVEPFASGRRWMGFAGPHLAAIQAAAAAVAALAGQEGAQAA